MLRYLLSKATTVTRKIPREMSQKQRSLTSFFSCKRESSSSSTTPSSPFAHLNNKPADKSPTVKSPPTSTVLGEKPATKNSKVKSPAARGEDPTVSAAARHVKKVQIAEEAVTMVIDDDDTSSSSPVKANKRRRVQILDSDSESDNENTPSTTTTPPAPTTSPVKKTTTPKRKTAKLSKEFRAKLSNRQQTPYVSKLPAPDDDEEEDSPEQSSPAPGGPPRPSPVPSSRLAAFAYKKRNTEQSPTRKQPKIEEKIETSPVAKEEEKMDSSTKEEKMDTSTTEATEDEIMKTEPSPPQKKKVVRSDHSSDSDEPDKKQPENNSTKKKTAHKTSTAQKTKQKTPVSSKKKKPALKKEVKSEEEDEAATEEVLTPAAMALVSASSPQGGYNPGKTKYKPISDACWKKGELVPYQALADTLKLIEATTKRLQKVELLSNFLRSVAILSPDELPLCVYLCTNQVAPAYKGIELGVGETVVMKAISEACGTNNAKLKAKQKELGDLGLVAEVSRAKQKMMFKPKPLTVKLVFDTLLKITAISGTKGQGQKVDLIKKLLVSCQGSEARFITRSLLGKLRCGLAEQTVLMALGQSTLLTPPGGDEECAVKLTDKEKIAEAVLIVKTCFCEHPDYEYLISMIREHGVLSCQEHCKLSPGVPVKPMLAHPTKGISEVLQRFEGSEFTCEFKYDGERAQIQCSGAGDVSIFSRNQENNTTKYPDIIARLGTCLVKGTETFILDCEVVAWDVEQEQILPFQILTTRKRKDADIKEIKVKVCLFAFDLLYLNGESLVREPFRKRRELLHSAFKEVKGEFVFATAKDCTDTEEIQEFLDESIKRQCEGLMVKTLDKDATYEISKRSHNWLKVKKDYLEGVGDSLDLVVIGAYNGKGKRSGTYGGFLLACYDSDIEQFQAICKIGTGFTDEDLSTHHSTLSEHLIDGAKSYYDVPESSSPDVWFEAKVVWEVKCADMTISPIYRAAAGLVDSEKGISLRFPRFIRIREDKTAEECTNASLVAELYNSQDNKQAGTTTEDY